MKELKTLKENLEKRRMIPAPTELKTLEDMIIRKYPHINYVREMVIVKELKAEAVKWVKRMNNYEALAWKKFFNLTEEDLK